MCSTVQLYIYILGTNSHALLQFDELEGLGYKGFAIGFNEGCSEIVGTSRTQTCFTPPVLEWIHALVTIGTCIIIMFLS